MAASPVPSTPGVIRTVFKLLKYLVLLVLVAVIGAAVAAYVGVNYVVRRVIEKEATAQLGVPTALGGATLGWTTGGIGLINLSVGSPAGFTAPQMLGVGSLEVATPGFTHLLDKPLHVTTIAVDAPRLVLEQKGLTLNVQALLGHLPNGTPGGERGPSPSTAGRNPLRLVIDTITIDHATVDVVPDPAGAASGLLGGRLGALGRAVGEQADKRLMKNLQPQTVTLPSLTVKNVGNADGRMQGAEVKDVAAAVIEAMAASAAKTAGLPIDPAALGGNLDSVKGTVQDQFNKLPGGAGGLLNGVLGGTKNGN